MVCQTRQPAHPRAYQNDLEDFCRFVGLSGADEFRAFTRAHVLAWRADLAQRGLAGATIRRKLAALASLFDHLLENNAVARGNPVHGVKRPKIETNEGKTPALGDHQAKALLEAPEAATLKGQCDRAILAVLLYHGLRREEAAQLMVADIQERRGIKHLRIHGKGGKLRFVPLHPVAAERIHTYLEHSGHQLDNPKSAVVCAVARAADRHRSQSQWPICVGWGVRQGRRHRGSRIGHTRLALNGSDQCPGARSGHRQGPSLARPCQHQHYADVRPPRITAGGFPYIQGPLLKTPR